jgi:hypothetical protein
MSIDPNELRRLHEAATPGEWAAFGRELCGPPKPGGRKGLCIFSTRAEDADSELCLYLRNHIPDILTALADRERLNKLEALLREGFDLVSDNNSPGNPYFFLQLEGAFGHDEVYRGDNDLRAVVDAARSAK